MQQVWRVLIQTIHIWTFNKFVSFVCHTSGVWKHWWWCACSILFIVSWLSLGRRVATSDFVSLLTVHEFLSVLETGASEWESSAVDQLPTSHTEHGSLLLLHSQLWGTARSDVCLLLWQKKVQKDVGRKCFVQATPQFNVCLMSLKPTLAVQRFSQLANQRSQPQRVPAPLPLYQANTNRGHPCITQATQQIQRLPPPPVHQFPPLQATAPLRLLPPVSRTPPASPPPRPRPQPQRQHLHRLSPNPRRICHSR